jgi:hypothetical protein
LSDWLYKQGITFIYLFGGHSPPYDNTALYKIGKAPRNNIHHSALIIHHFYDEPGVKFEA